VVCRSCERWNLTPFETRWEAIEQGEKAFRDTRVRVSTDNIGLARLRDGTELVRIGEPQRPEFAAWRYGDQFGRRRIRHAVTTIGVAGGAGLLASGASSMGIGVIALMPLLHVFTLSGVLISNALRTSRPIAHPDGSRFVPFGLPRLIESSHADGWGIDIGYSERYRIVDGGRVSLDEWKVQSYTNRTNGEIGRIQLHGTDAIPLLRQVLPRVNRAGASRSLIADGVQFIEQAGGPEHFGRWAATQRRAWSAMQIIGDTGDLQYIPPPARLAFEMALHEDAERRAMEGELAALERAWAEAEGIAAIADNLTVSPAIDQKLAELRAPVSPE
jgi:hypothetical protein